MELTHEEIDKYLEQVFAGTKIVDIGSDIVVFKFPDILTRMKARRIYEYEYQHSLEEGLLSTEAMKKLVESRHLITDEERNQVSSLKSKLDGQKVLLAKSTKVKANQDRIKKIIYDLEDQIRIIEYKERSKLSMTAENKAEEGRIYYLCWASTFNFYTDKLHWPDYDLFLHERDIEFRIRITSEFILFYSGIPTSIIRFIARSSLWRIRYVTSIKTAEPLFGVPTSEYTNDMLNLAYWSHYYQNVYEMLPDSQPPEDIIDDDDALDAYLKDYYDEQKREMMGRRRHKPIKGGKLSAFDKDEVIVTRASELYEDITYDKPRESQAIQDRNLITKKTSHSTKDRRGTIPDNIPRR
jgi:CRISPR/Cas system-associated endoribonuclease Cas2